MIKINPYSNIDYSVFPKQMSSKQSKLGFSGCDVSDLISKGNDALNQNRFQDALTAYKEANEKNPDEISLYRKLGKAYYNLKDYKNAEQNFKEYISRQPDDIEALIELGKAQSKRGFYKFALENFEKAYELDDKNDMAKRCILETKNNILSIHSPERAKQEKEKYAADNLKKAIDMTTNYMSASFMNKIKDISIQFGETAKMGGTSNIAQYENNRKTITISNSYRYAAPQVIAAYLTHESIHAHDLDGYTSVKEEQDAYETATKFWIEYSNGIKDPEMDYATGLYKKSPNDLYKRVEEIYKLRDPSIANTSPNHPPHKILNLIGIPQKKVSSQPITEYSIIA